MSNEHEIDHDVTQGENPGAQGDIGAGQGNPGDDESTVNETPPLVEGDEQPRSDELRTDEMRTDEQPGNEQI